MPDGVEHLGARKTARDWFTRRHVTQSLHEESFCAKRRAPPAPRAGKRPGVRARSSRPQVHMPCCAAWGCPSRTGNGMSFHRFPRNPDRRHLWEENVGRTDWKARDNSVLCQAHFDVDQYEKRRADNLHKLKQNAIPTMFALHQVDHSGKWPPRKQHVRSDDFLELLRIVKVEPEDLDAAETKVDDMTHSWKTFQDADAYHNGNVNGISIDTDKEVTTWKNATAMALNNQYSTFCRQQPSDKHHDGSTTAQQDYTDFHFELEIPNTTGSRLPTLAAAAATKSSSCQPHLQVDPVTQEILTQLQSHPSKKIMALQSELARARQHDTDDLYLLSLAPDIKSLKPEAKSLFKIRVQLLLHELKYGGKTNKTIHSSPNISHSTSPVACTFTPTLAGS
uniref:uncharacterized protein n=1 Tax=Myxine glutinosa TaxID=7769 RepID=UPI00358FBF80